MTITLDASTVPAYGCFARFGPGGLMTDGTHSGVDRRTAIARGAAAAGLVWSAPVLRSVRAFGAVGTPAPPTTPTEPTTTTYNFGGPVAGQLVVREPEPGCPLTVNAQTSTTVEGLGAATVEEHICVHNPEGPVVELSGSFLLTASGGTLVGTFTGQGGPPVVRSVAHHDITITSGTGIFDGATGTATLEATITSPLGDFEGTLTGSVTVP